MPENNIASPPEGAGQAEEGTGPGNVSVLNNSPVPANDATERFANIHIELTRMFDLLNQKFFGGEIITPVITIQTGRNGPKQFSWSSTRPVWTHEGNGRGSAYYEIALAGEFMNRPAEEVILSLCREMIHIYNAQRGIKDTSRGKTWHNRYFKTAAEKHGLVVEKSDKYGYSELSFGEELAQFVKDNVSQDIFTMYWTNPGPDDEDDSETDGEEPALPKQKQKNPKGKTEPPPSEPTEVNVALIAAGLDKAHTMDDAEENTSSRAQPLGKPLIGRTLAEIEYDDEDEEKPARFEGDAFGAGAPEEKQDWSAPQSWSSEKEPYDDSSEEETAAAEAVAEKPAELPPKLKPLGQKSMRKHLPYLFFCPVCGLAARATQKPDSWACPKCGGNFEFHPE